MSFIQVGVATLPLRSLDCAKITHNYVMTLASFLFSAFGCWMLHLNHSNNEEQGCTGMAKILGLVLALAYIIYNAAATEPPGVGTTALIVLAEVLLEGYTICKLCLTRALSYLSTVHTRPVCSLFFYLPTH